MPPLSEQPTSLQLPRASPIWLRLLYALNFCEVISGLILLVFAVVIVIGAIGATIILSEWDRNIPRTGADGRIAVGSDYFEKNGASLMKGWDRMSTVNGYNMSQESAHVLDRPQPETLPNSEQPEMVAGDEQARKESGPLQPPPPTPDYDAIVDDTNPNPNEKYL